VIKTFQDRHIGPSADEANHMLDCLGVDHMDELIAQTLPAAILKTKLQDVPEAMSEAEYLSHITDLASRNQVFKTYIGQGYYSSYTPSPILRNVFHNPGWYTQYTPYQAEIAQGRLEALLNFQTLVSDLTGMPLANASLLDEGTAAAEAMLMFYNLRNKKSKTATHSRFLVDRHTHQHVIDVLHTRAEPLDVIIDIIDHHSAEIADDCFGVLLQYPNALGSIEDYSTVIEQCKEAGAYVCIDADILSLALLDEPGRWGVDAVVGNTQRLGIPLGYGGPHAAYFATQESYKRSLPGRIIGVSVDRRGKEALRMALQTREQHIKREKATSNICTAQALLAIMAGMYGVYHGASGLKAIAQQIHDRTTQLRTALEQMSFSVINSTYFDTISITGSAEQLEKIRTEAEDNHINFYYRASSLSISLDEKTTAEDVENIISMMHSLQDSETGQVESTDEGIPAFAKRQTDYLTHEVFHKYQSETALMRYIKSLEQKDLSLVHSMIPLGSCTMKLNAATELIPVSFSGWSDLHPFVPMDQARGYSDMIQLLETYLAEITGFTACSLQPNSGAQGEYAGLLTIRAYHKSRGDNGRRVALIPSSAHGTNPASAVMAGMRVVVVGCDDKGNIDVDDLRAKCEEYEDELAALMITYPSTHGVFEEQIIEICEMIHAHGGMVYMDGANMNAQVGLTSPGAIGADVCHLNLHKTFSIPHGGGGPGMGPICVNDHLAPFLPLHAESDLHHTHGTGAVSSAPWGSASILLISYAYIRLLGRDGVTDSTRFAILNANYIMYRLQDAYQTLYMGHQGRVAHELILDLRPFKEIGVSAEDVAKRLIDYGFHAPTLSFPVPGTIMIEPTESENQAELDRFCDAMIAIKQEIDEIARGEFSPTDNVLVNAPHTVAECAADEWEHSYSRSKAAYPLPYLHDGYKFWPSVSRVNNAHGDRNLICTCPSVESYA